MLLACAQGRLDEIELSWSSHVAVSVVLASGGYPGDYETASLSRVSTPLKRLPGVTVYHAGTKVLDGTLVTSGGRVLNVTATGPGFASAIENAYSAVDRIAFDGAFCRRDIASRALTDRSDS